MANTTIPVELSSTPGIVDNSNATAITIDSSENVGIGTSSPSSYPVAPELVVDTGVSGGITVVSDSTSGGYGGVFFADGTTGNEQYRGFIQYNHNNSGSIDDLILGTVGTERLRIDADGRVTKPYQPAFLVTPTSQQSNLSGSTTVAFGTEIFDQDSNFASNTFTAPVTGKYQFNLTLYIVNFDVSATYVSFYIEASNRNVEIINSGSVFGATDPTYSSIAMGCLLDMDANDTCYIQCVQSGGAAQMDIAIYSRFSGFLVC
jgi:hypothetical protein